MKLILGDNDHLDFSFCHGIRSFMEFLIVLILLAGLIGTVLGAVAGFRRALRFMRDSRGLAGYLRKQRAARARVDVDLRATGWL